MQRAAEREGERRILIGTGLRPAGLRDGTVCSLYEVSVGADESGIATGWQRVFQSRQPMSNDQRTRSRDNYFNVDNNTHNSIHNNVHNCYKGESR